MKERKILSSSKFLLKKKCYLTNMERLFTLEAQVHLRKALTNNFIYLEGGLN